MFGVLGLLGVSECVVVAAEETQVVEHGFSAVCPGHNVVDVTPTGFAGASFSYTVTVPCNDRPTETSRNHPGFATHIKKFRFGTEHNSGDRSVTSQLADGFHVEHMTVLGLMETAGSPL
jgi:hypothetical protein